MTQPTIDSSVPRPEYPRPQWVRPDWLCLNGEWQFERDGGDSGLQRGLLARGLTETITVPFCPESVLSGIGETDFHGCVWYRREVEIPAAWKGRDTVLHFGAVDYDATVWVNGIEVGRHRGGFTPFSCPLAGVAAGGETAVIVVRARDNVDAGGPHPRGKQAVAFAPHSCFYTRTTGIWQTVWLEPLPRVHLKRPRITPDLGGATFHLELPLSGNRSGYRVRARLIENLEGGEGLCTAEARADLDLAPRLTLAVPPAEVRTWSPASPHLYGIEIELLDAAGKLVDSAGSYAGLRSVSLDGVRVKLNGETVFQRLVLDQGYYPDGVMTAPSDAALIRDIELSLAAGFNGARLHQKVFEERFLFHADRLGYLCWGEFGDWGCSDFGPSHDHQKLGSAYAAQWLEALERDYNHPSIIGWCGLNETWQPLHDRITELDDATRALFLAAKAMDTTRPVLDASGYSHRVIESDIYDCHDYIYDRDFQAGLERFRARYQPLQEGEAFTNPLDHDPVTDTPLAKTRVWSLPWRGQPYFVSEFGGFKWNAAVAPRSTLENETNRNQSWGYGSDPVSEEDFCQRFGAACEALLRHPLMFGYCYTQLTDVFPEENGLYAFDRTPKFDIARLHAVQTQRAAIEEAAQSDEQTEALQNAALREYARRMRSDALPETALLDETDPAQVA